MNLQNIFNEIEKIDPEINERLDTRRDAMKQFRNIGRVLALSALPIALGSMLKKAYGRTPADVLGVLNYALTLEYLEAEYYSTAITRTSLFPNAASLGAFTTIANHENAHVTLLKSAITGAGGTPVTKPTFDFTGGSLNLKPFQDYPTLLILAQAFEDTGVRAYKGKATVLMENPAVLTVALQIHSIEARHAAHIRYMRRNLTSAPQPALKPWITNAENNVPAIQPVYAGEDNQVQAGVTITGIASQVDKAAATEAFDEFLTEDQVLDIASLFIK
ncbi:ferritin-like domain-containing protein [Chitinophaga rhizophila]|uniref:Ferritin-like domain-containing protein n=1 Tax=Chitinophaga rhizophila TaxID=2866212 RepID=A0ABS7GFG3_9BACT|nr:ferritin-like domain-containing protein [Chitinophaga rhizophila]MBW8685980.1 ferritin-like domain-containing protein [Chitinophaga rhizophila]